MPPNELDRVFDFWAWSVGPYLIMAIGLIILTFGRLVEPNPDSSEPAPPDTRASGGAFFLPKKC